MVVELIILAIIVFLFEFDKEGKQWRNKEYQENRKASAKIHGYDRFTPKDRKERMRKRYGYIYDEWCREYDYKMCKYRVELTDAGPNRDKALTIIIKIPNMGLKHAMDVVDSTPSILLGTDVEEEANHYKMMLEEMGAKATRQDESEKVKV